MSRDAIPDLRSQRTLSARNERKATAIDLGSHAHKTSTRWLKQLDERTLCQLKEMELCNEAKQ